MLYLIVCQLDIGKFSHFRAHFALFFHIFGHFLTMKFHTFGVFWGLHQKSKFRETCFFDDFMRFAMIAILAILGNLAIFSNSAYFSSFFFAGAFFAAGFLAAFAGFFSAFAGFSSAGV